MTSGAAVMTGTDGTSRLATRSKLSRGGTALGALLLLGVSGTGCTECQDTSQGGSILIVDPPLDAASSRDGSTAPTPEGGLDPSTPLGGTVRLDIGTNFNPKVQAFASFFAPAGATEEARVSAENEAWTNASTIPTVALGSCGVPPYDLPDSPAPLVAVGTPLALKSSGAVFVPFQVFGGTSYSAAGSPAVVPHGSVLSLSIPGSDAVAAAELEPFLPLPPLFTLTNPSLETFKSIPRNTPWIVTWVPFDGELFVIRFPSGHICKAAPSTGTLSVSTDVLDAQTAIADLTIEFAAVANGASTITVAGTPRAVRARGSVITRFIPTYE